MRDDLDQAAQDHRRGRPIAQGSPDNLTIQIVRIDALPDGEAGEMFGQPSELPLPPLLEARMVFDGYRIVRELHASSRSHIYLAVDTESDELVVLKIPSIDLRGDPRLSAALHDGGVGRPAHQQPPRAEAAACSRASAITSTSSRNSSTARRWRNG